MEDINAHGIPDLIICLKGKFVAIELKNEDGKASALQSYNIDKINKQQILMGYITKNKYSQGLL